LLNGILFDDQNSPAAEKRRLNREQIACILALEVLHRKTGAFTPELDTETLLVFVEEVVFKKIIAFNKT
jgi:hypothetical protein